MGELNELDLDLAEHDARQDPIVLPIKGLGKFTFPGTLNALVKVRVMSWAAEGRTNDLTGAEGLQLFRDLLTDDTIKALSDAGFDVLDEKNLPAVEKIVKTLMAEYGRRDTGGDDPGGVPAVTPPPYSGTGPSSSPTSTVSTASPFPVT